MLQFSMSLLIPVSNKLIQTEPNIPDFCNTSSNLHVFVRLKLNHTGK